jgi:hypothetical protein
VRIGGTGSGSAVNIAIDNLDFDRTAPPDPGLPPVVGDGPAGPAGMTALAAESFTFTATDPEGEDVRLQVDWGDGRISAWSAFGASGAGRVIGGDWSFPGTYPAFLTRQLGSAENAEFLLGNRCHFAAPVATSVRFRSDRRFSGRNVIKFDKKWLKLAEIGHSSPWRTLSLPRFN